MRNVANDLRQQIAELACHFDRPAKVAMANSRADNKLTIIDLQAVQVGDAVYIDEVRRISQAQRHHWYQTLSFSEDEAAFIPNF